MELRRLGLTGLKVSIIGAVGGGENKDLVAITRGESEAWRIVLKTWIISTSDDVNRVRLFIGEAGPMPVRIIAALNSASSHESSASAW